MVLPRLSNSLEDAVLTVELVSFLCDWRKLRPRPSWSHQVAFRLYAANLLLAAGFTVSGTLLHIVDPLPQKPTFLWQIFVLTCVATPILFPIILTCALHPRMSSRSWSLCRAWLVVSATLHTLLLCTGVDLSDWGVQLPVVSFCGRRLDSRSIGGEGHGIDLDLLTSIPTTRGDGLFFHAMLFTAAAAVCLCVCVAAARRSPEDAESNGVPLALARRLVLALGIMLLGQVTMVPLLCVVGVARTLDVWHISIFVVMALAYSALRVLVCEPPGKRL